MTSRQKCRPRGSRGRGLALGAGVALAVGGSALGLTSPASAEVGTQIFDLSSDAVAVQSTATDPSIPLGLPFSIGSYGASSLLTSNGESAADAGAPYSPLVSSLPNTGNGVAYSTFGQALPVVPAFPGYVSAKDPVTPLAKQNAGGYELVATAGPSAARGTVNMGGQSATSAENNAFAYASSVSNADGVLSEASAGVHALTLDGILDLANFSSYASLTRTADGTTVPTTRTSLGTISFAALTSGFTDGGFTALGSAPTPVSADGLAALNDALKPAGATLTYLPERYTYTDGSTSTGPTVDQKKTVAGVVSGALQFFISYTSDRGTSTETITVGRVAVNAPSTDPGGAAAAPIDSAPTGAAALPSTGVDAGALPDAAGVAGAAPGSGLVGAAPTSANANHTFTPAASFRLDPQAMTSFDSVYIILAIAAATALLGGNVIRLVAIKLR
jgi:hypothetical protein